jgi:hypothetical protein
MVLAVVEGVNRVDFRLGLSFRTHETSRASLPCHYPVHQRYEAECDDRWRSVDSSHGSLHHVAAI